MILQALQQLYPRLAQDPAYEIAKPGYSHQNITYRVVLKLDGSLFAIQDARTPQAKGKPRPTRQLVLGEGKPPGKGINPCFLWDNMSYLLGYQKDDPKPERTAQSFQAFREKHLALESEIQLPEYSTLCRFLESWDVNRIHQVTQLQNLKAQLSSLENSENPNQNQAQQAQQLREQITHLQTQVGEDEQKFPHLEELSTGFGLFAIQGQAKPLNEHPQILAWWDSQEQASSADLGQCLLTGKNQVPIARLHPKIKGVGGAQSAGASLVSFNAPAYESYGKEQSFNAPVSEQAAFQYGTALNALLNGRQSHKHRLRIGDSTCVYWTDKPSVFEDSLGLFLNQGSHAIEQAQDENLRSQLQTILEAIRSGKHNSSNLGEDPEQTQFYLLGLAPNAARLSIRFFYQSSVGELLNNLHLHQFQLKTIPEYPQAKGKRLPDPEFPAIWQLLNQTARVSDEIPPLLAGALTRAILQATPYPESLLSTLIRRIRAEREIPYLKTALIKAILLRNHHLPIPTMLDTSNQNPAYLLGRLFATLEKTQEDAHKGQLNAGLRDKYYSSASATPASVFPRIMRTLSHHLAKLSGGQKVNREKLIQEIISAIPAEGFPKQLKLQDQGIFAIGYYHQRKDLYTKKEKPETEPAQPEA